MRGQRGGAVYVGLCVFIFWVLAAGRILKSEAGGTILQCWREGTVEGSQFFSKKNNPKNSPSSDWFKQCYPELLQIWHHLDQCKNCRAVTPRAEDRRGRRRWRGSGGRPPPTARRRGRHTGILLRRRRHEWAWHGIKRHHDNTKATQRKYTLGTNFLRSNVAVIFFDTHTYDTLHPFLLATETSTHQKRHFQVGLHFLLFLDCEGPKCLDLKMNHEMKTNRRKYSLFIFSEWDIHHKQPWQTTDAGKPLSHKEVYRDIFIQKKAQEGQKIPLKKPGKIPTAKNKNPQ